MRSVLFCIILLVGAQTIHAQSSSLLQDFSTCINSLPIGWQKYSVIGAEAWRCSNESIYGKGVEINGYNSGFNTNEDWLISPLCDFSTYSNPTLSFWSRTKYNGAPIEILLSSNYSGTGNPNAATWINLSASLPAINSDSWFLSDNSSLQAYKSQPCYIAIKYVSTSTQTSYWRLDDIRIQDATFFSTTKFINVGETTSGVASASKPFSFTVTGSVTNFKVEVPTPFEISKDSAIFLQQLNYPSLPSGNTQTLFIRINPNTAEKVYRSQISFYVNDHLIGDKILLLGTSLPDEKTISMFTWNMRWFGDPSSCNCDTSLARIHATKILSDIHADIYCLQEIVSNQQVAIITASLGSNYESVVSPFCSFAADPSDPSYAGGQKLAYIYNTDKVENLGTSGLLASTYPANSSNSSPYYCFASGRFPFMLKAKIKLANGLLDTLFISNIHAKASSDINSYDRRVCAVEQMTDSLNTLYANQKIVVIGDYNDYLEGATSSSASISPYQYLFDHGYTGITLPSKFPNQTTYVNTPEHIIDNIAINNNLLPFYPDSSTFIFNEIENYVMEYVSTTSDHLPIMTYLKFNYPTKITETPSQNNSRYFDLINPSDENLQLYFKNTVTENISIAVYNLLGNKIYTGEIPKKANSFKAFIPNITDGIYFVTLIDNAKRTSLKWVVKK